MKVNKKTIRNAIVLTLAAVVLVTATVFTTLAYLVSTAKVSNVFTVGDVTIEMYETKVSSDGKFPDGYVANNNTPGYEPNSKKKADTNTYAIVPGGNYFKDPTIYVNPNSAETILFVKARNQIGEIETKDAPKTMKEQMIDNGWRRVAQMSNGDWLYVFVGDGSNAAAIIPKSPKVQAFDLFTEFSIDPSCNLEQYKLAQGAAVTLTAYAIQADGFNTNGVVSKGDVVEAWNAIVSKVSYEAGNDISEYIEETTNDTP